VADVQQAMPADRDLVVAMASGDSKALRSLNARYGRMLAALARRFLSNLWHARAVGSQAIDGAAARERDQPDRAARGIKRSGVAPGLP